MDYAHAHGVPTASVTLLIDVAIILLCVSICVSGVYQAVRELIHSG